MSAVGRRWWGRVALLVLAVVAAEAGLHLLDAHADPLRLVLLLALLVVAGGLLLDSTPLLPTSWARAEVEEERLARLDPQTASYLRVLESHLAARHVDDGLRARLRDLAERALRARHGLGVDDPRAGVLLGEELAAVLSGPVRRLEPDRIERCVRRIEEL